MENQDTQACVLVEVTTSKHIVLIWEPEKRRVPVFGGAAFWKFPGGHVRKNEGVIAAACRELEEETGIRLSEEEFTRYKKSQHADRYGTRFHIEIPESYLEQLKEGLEGERPEAFSAQGINRERWLFPPHEPFIKAWAQKQQGDS